MKMKRLRNIFRCPKSFRPRCLRGEDDVARFQPAEEVYQRSGYSDAGLKPKPEVPAEPCEVCVQFILPGQCEELTSQEEPNLPVNPELKRQVEELLGTQETTSICDLSESEEEVHVPTEPEVKTEIEALPDPTEAASSSDFAELEQDLHELQCMVDAMFDSPAAPCFSDLSDSEEEQHVLAETEVKTEIKALPNPSEAASSSDFAELGQDLHELQCMFDAMFDSPEEPCFSDLSDSEEEQQVLAEPEVKTEIEALPYPSEAASSSDLAGLEQELHELQCMADAMFESPEEPCFSDLSDSEEEQQVLVEPEVKTEIEALPYPSEASSSSDFADLEQELHELQCMVDAMFESPEEPCFSDLSDSEEEQRVLAEPEVKIEIEALPNPSEDASSSDFAELEQDLHELQCMADAIFDSPEEPCFSDLSDSEEEQQVLIEPEVKNEIEALPYPSEAAFSSDLAGLEQDLHELQCMFDAMFDSPEEPCFSDLSDSEEEQRVLAEPEVKNEIEALPNPSEAASSSDFADLEQDLHELQCEVEAFHGSSEVPCFSDLSDSEEVLYFHRESEVDTESEFILSEATSGLQDFRCCAVLGQGAFGKVLLAEYKQTQDMVAIKAITKADVIRRKHTERLRCEKEIFQTVSSACHPFLINLFTSFQDEHYIFFVMEYAAGGDLQSNKPRITDSFPEVRAVFYAACVVLGLEFLHQNKIIHRDLKLENVVLDKEGFAKLTDFGLSKAGIGFGDRTKSIVGTPLYMAPEMMGWQPYSRDVDWWSFGILIYDMLAAHTPFDARNNRVKLKHNIATSEVAYPQDWSPESTSLVSQLLVKNPTQRLGSGEKGAEDVKAHPFFRDIDWRKLFLRELRPPFLPPLSGPKDVSNFDAVFTSLAPVLTPPEGPDLTQEQQDLFKDFDWTAEWAP